MNKMMYIPKTKLTEERDSEMEGCAWCECGAWSGTWKANYSIISFVVF